MNFAIDADLANASGDQLRVLRAEVQDQDLVGVDVLHSVFLPVRVKKIPASGTD
jgi:hypothetical protein